MQDHEPGHEPETGAEPDHDHEQESKQEQEQESKPEAGTVSRNRNSKKEPEQSDNRNIIRMIKISGHVIIFYGGVCKKN